MLIPLLMWRSFLVALRLWGMAHEMPDVDHPEMIDPFVTAALAEETPNAPAALLIALGWGESRFDPRAQPACGAMQVYPNDLDLPWSKCEEWRKDLRAGVRTGVLEIEIMLADKRVAGNLYRALLYRACGNSAFNGTCNPNKYAWVDLALARYHALERGSSGGTGGAVVPSS